MPLNSKDQLNVLYDLLTEQSEDLIGSVSECQQIQRLVKSMLTKGELNDQELNHHFSAIYDYGRQGEMTQDINHHITSNQQQLNEWITSIDKIKS